MAVKISLEMYLEAWTAFQEHGQNYAAAARSINLSASAFRNRIESGERTYGKPEAAFEAPSLPNVEMETGELLTHLTKREEARKVAAQARKWMTFKMNVEGPYGLTFMGDPHLGDNGCAITKLRADMEIARNPDLPLFLVCMGDTGNFWSNRLQRLYMEQETSLQQELQLAEWFFGTKKLDESLLWFLILLGNHDMMQAGVGELLKRLSRGTAPCEEWQAQFVVKSPNGFEFRVWAAHDFPGGSQYSTVFSPHKKGMLTAAIAHLYICAHRHNWGLHLDEDAESGRTFWSARARGYKFDDDYARRLGYADHHHGMSITAIVDPNATDPNAVTCFPDTETAADYLTWLRQRS